MAVLLCGLLRYGGQGWFKAWAERRRDDAQCGRGGERSWSDYVEQREERAEVSGIPGYEAVVGLC